MRNRYAGRATDNEFPKFENPFFRNPAPLARIAARDRKKREQARDRARQQKYQAYTGFDY